ncbi:hypothetical protein M2232_001851 [Bradyrhizobium japonicum]|uniref:hypothetical protein n=1 Tax=Bradyrhizobium japonicum TaxID=375 RepID=UPI002225C97A|nr:hypothetical protein [Bradyrhizobium japonicum]MCW2218319.1 hypothetical protein [Bradyrhizobium japonicum]MCW2342933.1 hypothetical protein [Bradyrhizobium japonicum]
MSEKLVDLIERRTVAACEAAASALFKEISAKFGQDKAQEIFRLVSSNLSDDEVREFKNLAILRRYDGMSEPNVAELARQLVAENEAAVKEGRPAPNGPRGSTNLMTMDKHIRNIIDWRERGIADGTWLSLGKVSWPKHLSRHIG